MSLFNGKDLTGWQGLIDVKARAKMTPEQLAEKQKKANADYLPHWQVKNGVIVYDGKGNNLQTVKDYGDFQLYVDWKIEEKGDSGIYLRGHPQVQIWDSDKSPGAKGEDKGSGSGGLWNNPAGSKGKMPTKKADKPVGEWNTFHITMKGDKVTVILNGEKVVDERRWPTIGKKASPYPPAAPLSFSITATRCGSRIYTLKSLIRFN